MPIPCKGKALNQENSILGLGTVTFAITMALQAALGNRAHSPLHQLYWLFQGNIVTYGRYVLAFRDNPKKRLKGFLYLEEIKSLLEMLSGRTVRCAKLVQRN